MSDTFDNFSKDTNTIRYKGFRFTREIERTDIGVLLKIFGYSVDYEEQNLIYSIEITDESYLNELEEMIVSYLDDWLMNNTTEQDRIFVALKNWYIVYPIK